MLMPLRTLRPLGFALLLTAWASAMPPEEAQGSAPQVPVPAQLKILAGMTDGPLGAPAGKLNGIAAVRFLDEDPAMGDLNGKWLVGDRDGLKVLGRAKGRLKVTLIPGSPKDIVSLAVRPRGCGPDCPLHVVFAQVAQGKPIRSVLWSLEPGGAFRQLTAPGTRFGLVGALALGTDGTVLLADQGCREIRKVSRGGRVTIFARIPPRDPMDQDWDLGDPAPLNARGDAKIIALTVNPASGDLYVADHHMIHRVTPQGQVTPLLGSLRQAGFDPAARAVAPGTPCLCLPGALQVAEDRLYILDSWNRAVRSFDLRTRILKTLVGHPDNGETTRLGSAGYADPAPAVAGGASLPDAIALALGPDGTLVLATSQALVRLELDEPIHAQPVAPPAVAAAPHTLWEALLAPRSDYDPDAVAQLLAALPEGATANAPYAGSDPGLAGATPLMSLLDHGDEANAITLIDLMRSRGEAGWNAICPAGPGQGATPWYASILLQCPQVARKLMASPEVDTAPELAMGAGFRPALILAWLRGETELAQEIIARNAGRPSYFTLEFPVGHTSRRSIKTLFTDPLVQAHWKADPEFKALYAQIRQATLRGAKAGPAPNPGVSASQTAAAPAAAEAAPDPSLMRALAGCRMGPLQQKIQDTVGWQKKFLRDYPEAMRILGDRAASDLQVNAMFQSLVSQPQATADLAVIWQFWTDRLATLKAAPPPKSEAQRLEALEQVAVLKAEVAILDGLLTANLASAEQHGRAFEAMLREARRNQPAHPEVAAALDDLVTQVEAGQPPPVPPIRAQGADLDLDLTGEGYTLSGLNSLIDNWNEHPAPLEALILSGNPIGQRGDSTRFENFLARNQALRSLRLGHCQLGDAMALRAWLSVLHHPALVDLDLSGNGLTDSGGVALAALLAESAHLQNLDLRGNRFQDRAFNALVQAVRLHPSLTVVKVRSYDPRSVGYQEQLDQILAGRRLHGAGAQPGQRPVQDLDWTRQQLTLRQLAVRLEALNQDPIPVQHLTLTGNPLGQGGDSSSLEAFLAQNLALKTLKLNHCGLGDARAMGIWLAVFRLPALEVLDLADNELTQASGLALASMLASNASLQELDLSGNRFDRNTFPLLVQAVGRHPNLRVVKVRRAQDPDSEKFQTTLDQILAARNLPGKEN